MNCPETHSRDRWVLAAILCLACVLRIGVCSWRADQLVIDRDAYLGIAENLANGRGFCAPQSTTPTAYRPPLYPLLVSVNLLVLPTAWAVALINVVAGVVTVWLVGLLGQNWQLGNSRFVAAGLIAVDPLLLHATPQPMTEVLFTCLTTCWLWTMTRTRREAEPAWKWPIITGVGFGLAALCRPTIWPLAGLLVLSGVIPACTSKYDSRIWRQRAITLLATIAVVAPWVIRNQICFGQPILMTTHGGYTIYLANNPTYYADVVQQPSGTTWSGESLARWQSEYEQKMKNDLGPQPSEVAGDAWMSAAGKKYIQEHPREFVQLMWHRIRCLWNITPQGEGTSLPWQLRGGVASFYALEFLLAAIGLWSIVFQREWNRWLPGLLLILTIQGIHLVYWTDTRMRTPLEPVLALLAANAVFPCFARQSEPEA